MYLPRLRVLHEKMNCKLEKIQIKKNEWNRNANESRLYSICDSFDDFSTFQMMLLPFEFGLLQLAQP